MTPAETMQLEALRTVAVAALTAMRGVVQGIDAVLLEPNVDAGPNDDGTFDDSSTTENSNGRQATKVSRRKRGG